MARKLWLGFGVLILVLACLIIFLSERTVNNTLDEVVGVEEPTRAARSSPWTPTATAPMPPA